MNHIKALHVNAVRVLVVDDDWNDFVLVQNLAAQISGRATQVTIVTSINAAQLQFDENYFDIILLNLFLADSSGLETLLRLKSKSRKIPILILTTTAHKAIALQAVDHGADDWILKSNLNSSELRRAISFALVRDHFLKMRTSFGSEVPFNFTETGRIKRTPLGAVLGLADFVRQEDVARCDHLAFLGSSYCD